MEQSLVIGPVSDDRAIDCGDKLNLERAAYRHCNEAQAASANMLVHLHHNVLLRAVSRYAGHKQADTRSNGEGTGQGGKAGVDCT